MLTRAAELFERMAGEMRSLADVVLQRTASIQGEVGELFARQMTEGRHAAGDVVHLLFVPREVCSWESGPGVRGATDLHAGDVTCSLCREYLMRAGLLPVPELPPLMHFQGEVAGRHYCGAPFLEGDHLAAQVEPVTCRRCVERLEFFGLRAKSGSAAEQRQMDAIRALRGASVREALRGEVKP